MLPASFLELSNLFEQNGFSLYVIGGTSRDILLGIDPADFDYVTDATPEDEKKFLPDARYEFARFGSVKIFKEGVEIDITTLREEGEYRDFRHPSYVKFIKSPEIDSRRRDFTINALYIDKDENVLDFHGGLEDLQKKRIRFIGDPDLRIKEDPLRILRAYRFQKRLEGFHFDPATEAALRRNEGYLEKLNPAKVKMEREKE
jgi:tRNA nucleotidyltransferase/poly(A) polymerase